MNISGKIFFDRRCGKEDDVALIIARYINSVKILRQLNYFLGFCVNSENCFVKLAESLDIIINSFEIIFLNIM